MKDTINKLTSAIGGQLGTFIVLWFILGGAVTFAAVVLTAQLQWPGIYYVALWLALGVLFSPTLLLANSEDK